MADIEKIKTEINTDPLGRNYVGMTDQEVADSLNTADRPVTRSLIPGWEIFNATDDAEYGVLSAANKTSWDNLCGIEFIDTSSGVAKSLEASLFGAGTTTRTNLIALKSLPPISRAEELDLLGNSIEIGPAHVAAARAL